VVRSVRSGESWGRTGSAPCPYSGSSVASLVHGVARRQQGRRTWVAHHHEAPVQRLVHRHKDEVLGEEVHVLARKGLERSRHV